MTLIKVHLEETKGENKQGIKHGKLGKVSYELIDDRITGNTLTEKLHNAYHQLQMRTNALFDQSENRADGKGSQPGLKQLLEKKEVIINLITNLHPF